MGAGYSAVRSGHPSRSDRRVLVSDQRVGSTLSERGSWARHRVLHVATTIEPGGAENHLRDLTAGLTKRGHTVGVAYLRGGDGRRSEYAANGVAPYPLNGH